MISVFSSCWCIFYAGVSERVKLKRTDFPLVLRVMQGPCEQVCKIFLMEEDLGEEVTYDVSHSMNFPTWSSHFDAGLRGILNTGTTPLKVFLFLPGGTIYQV